MSPLLYHLFKVTLEFFYFGFKFSSLLSFWLTKGAVCVAEMEVTKLKNKMFLLLLRCHKNMSVFKYWYSSQSIVTLPYPNLTWLPSSFGVKLDNGVE